MITLGAKIKGLRNQKGISQFNMETDLGLGYGSLSRIETDKIQPNRTSLLRFAEYLKLNDREVDYLIGSRSSIATEEEIAQVIMRMKDAWNVSDAFVLLRDDRFRICEASLGMKKLFNVNEKQWSEKYYLRSIASVFLDPELPFFQSIANSDVSRLKNEIKAILSAFYFETKSMVCEEVYEETLRYINNNEIAKEVWAEIVADPKPPVFLLIKDKHFTMKIGNNELALSYYTETLPESPKFAYLEFFPSAKVIA